MTIIQHTHITNPENSDDILGYRIDKRKVYFVANLAFNDGAKASAQHYDLPLGKVYAAMAFYKDNEDLIKQRLSQIEKQYEHLRIESDERVTKLRERMEKIHKEKMEKVVKDIEYYMRLPYTISLTPPDPNNPHDTWFAEIVELDGVMTWGESGEKVLKLIEDAKRVWIAAVLEDKRIDIPEPE